MGKLAKKQKMDKWSVDKYGFVSSGKCYFHLENLDAVFMHNPTQLTIHIKNTICTMEFNNERDARGLYKWFTVIMCLYRKQKEKHHQEHHKISEEMVSIMKKNFCNLKGVK